MPAPYNAASIANLFLRKSIADDHPIDPMKLQKLAYFAHGYYLALTQVRLHRATPLVDEFFEAWKFGPVLPSVYHKFKEFGGNPITSLAMEFHSEFGTFVVALPPTDDARLDRVASFVWDMYGKKHSLTLSNMTHKADGAWDKARRLAAGLKGKDIPNEDIAADFLPYIT
jgi:uncharacterized phage-associated protein